MHRSAWSSCKGDLPCTLQGVFQYIPDIRLTPPLNRWKSDIASTLPVIEYKAFFIEFLSLRLVYGNKKTVPLHCRVKERVLTAVPSYLAFALSLSTDEIHRCRVSVTGDSRLSLLFAFRLTSRRCSSIQALYGAYTGSHSLRNCFVLTLLVIEVKLLINNIYYTSSMRKKQQKVGDG